MFWRAAPLCLLLLVGCSAPTQDFNSEVVPIGNFRLGEIVPRAEAELTKGPFSRSASREDWMDALDLAFNARFSRFEGGSYYHLGITAAGYVLAKPGIPVIGAPKSILIFTVIVLEDHTGKTLTEKPHQIMVIEQLSGGSFLGSGFIRRREEQLTDLAQQAASATENWLRTQPWFDGPDTIVELPDNLKPSVGESATQ